MLKIFNYISNRGGKPISPEVTNIPTDFESFRGIFEQTLEQEMFVTEQFNNIAARCQQANDYVTFNFLSWFLEEQVEEEYIARRILELFDVIGEEGTGRWEIDRHLVKVAFDGE
jgi:ferritin